MGTNARAKRFPDDVGASEKILQRHKTRLTVTVDKPGNYSLDAAYWDKLKRGVFFLAHCSTRIQVKLQVHSKLNDLGLRKPRKIGVFDAKRFAMSAGIKDDFGIGC